MRLGIKQTELGRYVGIGRTAIQGIEQNRQGPSAYVLMCLALILTNGQIDQLTHKGLSDEEEFNDARYGHPHGPQGRAVGSMDVRTSPVVPVDVRRGGDEIRGPVRPLRSSFRPHPHGA